LISAACGAAPAHKSTRTRSTRGTRSASHRTAGVRLPLLPPASPRAHDQIQARMREEALRERLAVRERELAETRAREKQTEAKLQEMELMAGGSGSTAAEPDPKLAHLVDLYRRLQTIDKERSQLQASAKPDTRAIKDLDNEREAIFQW